MKKYYTFSHRICEIGTYTPEGGYTSALVQVPTSDKGSKDKRLVLGTCVLGALAALGGQSFLGT